MYRVYKAIHDRMYKFLMAETKLTSDASVGSSVLSVDDASHFDFEGVQEHYPYIILMDDNTTGRQIADGYEGAEIVSVDRVDTTTNQVFIHGGVSDNWLTSNNAYIQRCPGGTVVRDVVIGDLSVVTKYPTVCVVPTSKAKDWFTMPGGTTETVSVDFITYTAEGDTQYATEELLKLTDVVEWILMSNLHIQIQGASSIYEVTSTAMTPNIDYGVIQKGSEFLKSSRISWTGDVYVLREYLHGMPTNEYEGVWDKDHS